MPPRTRGALGLAAAPCLLAAAVFVQTPVIAEEDASEHQAHHPAAAASAPAMQPDSTPNGAMPGTAGGMSGAGGGMSGMMEGMERMMEHGRSGADPLYPRLMGAALTEAQRLEVRRLAEQRVHAGEEMLQAAHARLARATEVGDHGAAQVALQQAREALGRMESGVSAHRLSLQQGGRSQEQAVDWLRSDLGLARESSPAHGLFGLTWFHYLLMAAIIGAGLLLAGVQWHKRRRAGQLLERLAGGAAPGAAVRAAEPAFRLPVAAVQPQAAADAPPAPAAAAAGVTRLNTWTGELEVTRIFDEVPGVKTFRLADPASGELPFRYLPGQFLTVAAPIAGQTARRSYTIASSPAQPFYCEITVRHEPGGLVSGYLHDQVSVGSRLRVSAASGKFTFVGDDADSIVLIAGGVGVTPMMGVIRYLTDRSWRGEMFLVYACKTADGFMFRPEIEHLVARHPNLHVTFVAEQADPASWPYATGRISTDLLSAAVPQITRRHIHLCGPKPMMEAAKQMLAQLGVPAEQVETEVFQGKERPLPSAPSAAPVPAGGAVVGQAMAIFSRSGKTAPLPPSKTILEASEDVGVNIEYSCRTGVCGICKVKLQSGSVTMEVEDALTDEDRAQGIVLACQAKASSNVTVEA